MFSTKKEDYSVNNEGGRLLTKQQKRRTTK